MPFKNSPHEIEHIAYLLKSITEGKDTVYVSVPMTTGPRFMNWYCYTGSTLASSSDEYKREHNQSVRIPNCESARNAIVKIRRKYHDAIVIDPTNFESSNWEQEEYHFFWGKVIECCAKKAVFLNGWQYSSGCCYEFLIATRIDIETMSEDGSILTRELGSELILGAIEELQKLSLPTIYLERVARELGLTAHNKTLQLSHENIISLEKKESFKDAILNQLANNQNVAQFISFAPGTKLKQRFTRIIGLPPNHTFPSPKEAIEELLKNSDDNLVNIRTYRPDHPKGSQFFYGKNNPDEILQILENQAGNGLYTIVNETIDVEDGGVSGVLLGNVMEVAPYDTPQCVDLPGVCSLPKNIALTILENVYGFRPNLNFDPETRVEFSIHPRKRGLHREHTIIWEKEKIEHIANETDITWPNRFSQMIGDKVFGLLIADAIGLPVPQATVISRAIAPFKFGRITEKWDMWIRTCPKIRVPGKFPTICGWGDPFEFMNFANTEISNKDIASLLAQDGVYPEYSGSLISGNNGEPLIEGIKGRGDKFMIGQAKPEKLPDEVIDAVSKQYKNAYRNLGPIEMEWVYDGLVVWVLQLHKSNKNIGGKGNVIYPGTPKSFYEFDVEKGLEELRALIGKLEGSDRGIILKGNVGVTSHFGDLLRSARIPSRVEWEKSN